MINKKVLVTTTDVVEISGRELEVIKTAINYAWHRSSKHGKSQAGDKNELQSIRQKLGIKPIEFKKEDRKKCRYQLKFDF